MKIIGIIIAILCFGVLVIGHEFGHFSVAKALGIKVNEFSVGMGPLIFQKKKGETEYSLRALPFGGYCALEGEDEDTGDPSAFVKQPYWKQLLVLAAGSFNNLVLGLLIFTCVFMYAGSLVPKLSEVTENGPAQVAGIQVGDTIVSIDGVEYSEWADITKAIQVSKGDTVKVGVVRGGQRLDYSCVPAKNEAGTRVIGIVCSISHSPGRALKTAFSECTLMIRELQSFFVRLFKGKVQSDEVGSVVQIVAIAGDTAENYGIINVIYLMALVSVNLGFMNLLPIPALDGGHILFVFIRWITGGRLSTKVEAVIHSIFMALLLALMAFLMVRDAIGLF